MVKTLRDTISKTLHVEYELHPKALEELKNFESCFTDTAIKDLDSQRFNFTISRPLRYITQYSGTISGLPLSDFFGPDIDKGKYLYLEQWISISTTKFKEVFAKDLIFGAFDVRRNILSFLTCVKNTVNELNSQKFKQLYDFAIRSIFSKTSENKYIPFQSAQAILTLYVYIADGYLNRSNVSIQDDQLNTSFVECLKTYIDTVYHSVIENKSSKTHMDRKNFVSFLNMLSKCCDNLESDGMFDTLEQLKLNIKEVLSDRIDKMTEIEDTREDGLNRISGPLKNLSQTVGFKVN